MTHLQMKRCPKCNKLQMAGRLHTCATLLRDRKDDARKADEPRKQDLHTADEGDVIAAIVVDAIAFTVDALASADATLDQVADSMEPPTASDPAPAFDGGGGGEFGGGGASGSWDSGSSSDSTSDSGGYDGGSSGGGGD